jgi:FkbM family methyltransferase
MSNVIAHTFDRLLSVYGHLPYHRGKWRISSWLSRYASPAWGKDRIIVRDGIRFETDLVSDEVGRMLYTDGHFDPYETSAVRQLVRKEWVCFDIGANVGYYSLLLSRLCSKVYSFEPMPHTYSRLVRNLELNGVQNVTTFCQALGSSHGQLTMTNSSGNSTGTAHISAAGDFAVKVSTVDEMVDSMQIQRLDFIKSDVEGYECEVLKGGSRTFQRFRPVILVEVNATMLSEFGATSNELVNLLRGWSYDLYIVGRQGLTVLSAESSRGYQHYFNVMAVPSEQNAGSAGSAGRGN